MEDRLALREPTENWALWRDAGDWVWHPVEGWMTATWFQGPAKARPASSAGPAFCTSSAGAPPTSAASEPSPRRR
ncbi:hypothetical protein A4R44_09291 [Amycolatopsis sp. M39]|uniref:Uncharacterized protein n=1 Tax=Amycolatopsis rubida TaxID=112413 RepID=A0A1I5VHF1_9PSEU|nr:hypothetical protein A4R44_09291 [Amycolatopsis sp. M39]SFQ06851.1 hypothetical protein SAMN05421854_108352 [Amycolatopsis rubida]